MQALNQMGAKNLFTCVACGKDDSKEKLKLLRVWATKFSNESDIQSFPKTPEEIQLTSRWRILS